MLLFYLAVYICVTEHTLNTVTFDPPPLMLHVFFMKAQGTGSFVLQRVCVSRSQGWRRLPVSAAIFGGLITAAEFLGSDGASLGFVETELEH